MYIVYSVRMTNASDTLIAHVAVAISEEITRATFGRGSEVIPFEQAIAELVADPYILHREDVLRRHLRSGGSVRTYTARYEMAREDVERIRRDQAAWLAEHVASFASAGASSGRSLRRAGRLTSKRGSLA